MIRINPESRIAKHFVWCCDYLPLTTGYDEKNNARKGSFYLDRGTTLCHIFWAILWVPMIIIVMTALLLYLLAVPHIESYLAMKDRYGIAAAFIPEGIILVLVLVVGFFILAILGANKTGFWTLLWSYLKGLKQRVCPLVQFKDGEGA